MYHKGDPCIHCGTPHDLVAPGACEESSRFLSRLIRAADLMFAVLDSPLEDLARGYLFYNEGSRQYEQPRRAYFSVVDLKDYTLRWDCPEAL